MNRPWMDEWSFVKCCQIWGCSREEVADLSVHLTVLSVCPRGCGSVCGCRGTISDDCNRSLGSHRVVRTSASLWVNRSAHTRGKCGVFMGWRCYSTVVPQFSFNKQQIASLMSDVTHADVELEFKHRCVVHFNYISFCCLRASYSVSVA